MFLSGLNLEKCVTKNNVWNDSDKQIANLEIKYFYRELI